LRKSPTISAHNWPRELEPIRYWLEHKKVDLTAPRHETEVLELVRLLGNMRSRRTNGTVRQKLLHAQDVLSARRSEAKFLEHSDVTTLEANLG
jgi:hypothetical protein